MATDAVVTYTATSMLGLIEVLTSKDSTLLTPCTDLKSSALLHGTLGLSQPLSFAISTAGYVRGFARGLSSDDVRSLDSNSRACGAPVVVDGLIELAWSLNL